jgi:hypothetical protein
MIAHIRLITRRLARYRCLFSSPTLIKA